LLVDEVLAVGDAEFQKRCLGMMRDAADSGRTVIFVSHQMSAISSLCNRAFYLEQGELRFAGDTDEAIELYLGSYASTLDDTGGDGLAVAHRGGGGEWRVGTAKPTKDAFGVDEEKTIDFDAHRVTDHEVGVYAWENIVDESGSVVTRCDSRLSGVVVPPGTGAVSFRLSIRTPWLRPGRYFVDLYLGNYGIYDAWERACTFEVLPLLPYPYAAEADALTGGTVLGDFEFRLV
jgi:lipopolysaccharide transport system ATP-binding protein